MSPVPEAARNPGMVAPVRKSIRRRPSPEQGRALEILGHAIEYLIDSYVAMQVPGQLGSLADVEAIQTLISMNRLIFSESEIVVPAYMQLLRWFGVTAPSIASIGWFLR